MGLFHCFAQLIITQTNDSIIKECLEGLEHLSKLYKYVEILMDHPVFHHILKFVSPSYAEVICSPAIGIISNISNCSTLSKKLMKLGLIMSLKEFLLMKDVISYAILKKVVWVIYCMVERKMLQHLCSADIFPIIFSLATSNVKVPALSCIVNAIMVASPYCLSYFKSCGVTEVLSDALNDELLVHDSLNRQIKRALKRVGVK